MLGHLLKPAPKPTPTLTVTQGGKTTVVKGPKKGTGKRAPAPEVTAKSLAKSLISQDSVGCDVLVAGRLTMVDDEKGIVGITFPVLGEYIDTGPSIRLDATVLSAVLPPSQEETIDIRLDDTVHRTNVKKSKRWRVAILEDDKACLVSEDKDMIVERLVNLRVVERPGAEAPQTAQEPEQEAANG